MAPISLLLYLVSCLPITTREVVIFFRTTHKQTPREKEIAIPLTHYLFTIFSWKISTFQDHLGLNFRMYQLSAWLALKKDIHHEYKKTHGWNSATTRRINLFQ